jgi:hypothetical protein
MKRITLFTLVFCMLFLTIAGVGVVAATPETRFQFDVTFEGNVVGTVTIDAKQQTYAFTGNGLTADTKYFLVCHELMRSLGSATTTRGGTLQMKGNWSDSFWDGLTVNPTFELSTIPVAGGLNCPYIGLSAHFYTYVLWETVHGYLWDANEQPLANKELRILKCDLSLKGVATTQADGSYSFTRAFWMTFFNPMVVYEESPVCFRAALADWEIEP